MKITPPADDYGTETLRRNNQEKSVQESDHVEPYPPITPQQRHSPHRPPVERRRQGERRKQERRKRKGHTLHSTRLHQERRTNLRRRSDLRTAIPAKETERPDVTVSKRGIDEFA
jgi:hypothetical protein